MTQNMVDLANTNAGFLHFGNWTNSALASHSSAASVHAANDTNHYLDAYPQPFALPLHCNDKALEEDLAQLLLHKLINPPKLHECLPYCELCSPVSQDDYIFFNLCLLGILLPLCGLLGLMGNALSAFVYSRPECRSSTNLYLCALGCSDSAVIITAIFVFGLDSYRKYSVRMYTIYAVVSPIVYPMGLIAQTCSVYFTLVAGADCFAQACLSSRIRSLVSRSSTIRWSIITVTCFSIAYNIPHCFESVVIRCFHEKFQTSTFELCPDPFRFNELYSIIYYKYMYSIFVAVGPLCCLILMNISIIAASVFGVSSSNMGDTIALVLVVLLFIICNTAALLLNIFDKWISENLGDYFNYIVDLSNIMVVFNSSFNFVIYVTFSETFRRTFIRYVFNGQGQPILQLPRNFSPSHLEKTGSMQSCIQNDAVSPPEGRTLVLAEPPQRTILKDDYGHFVVAHREVLI